MSICQERWPDLKTAIRQRGMWQLVTPSEYRTAVIPDEILKLNATQYALDLLMAASLMAWEQAWFAFGSALVTGVDCRSAKGIAMQTSRVQPRRGGKNLKISRVDCGS